MIEAVLVTILPVGFLVIIFLGGALFQKKKISQDGEAPINRTLFYASKWSIVVLWGAMALARLGDRILTRSGAPLPADSLRSGSGVPDSRSCISGDSNWGSPFVSEPRRRTPASRQTGYSG